MNERNDLLDSNSQRSIIKKSAVTIAVTVPVKEENFLYVKPSLMQMLDYELSESKKDDITMQNVFNGIKEVKVNSTVGRLALSRNASRFELPMDMKQLESMDPMTYLRKFCKINDRRKALYKRIFDKYKIKSDKEDFVDMNLLEECIMDVHMKSITKPQYNHIVSLACVPPNTQITFTMFSGLAALSERILYDKFATEDTKELPQYQKDKIESADFGSLKSKIHGIKINPNMLTLLEALQSS